MRSAIISLRFATGVFLLIVILCMPVQALQTFSGDSITISTPVDDDVFASGSTININAPVSSAVVAAGSVNINAPIENDLFVAGGQITVNSDIGGKIVAAGGNIVIAGNVATNVVIFGGNVQILSTSTIGRDAAISGGSVVNAGKISGNLTVNAGEFRNTGSAARVDFEKNEFDEGFLEDLRQFFNVLSILITAGMIIPGILAVKWFPAQFLMVEEELRKSPLKNAVIGFVLIITAVVLIAILAITVIGMPLALILSMLFIISLIFSTIFVSFSIGRKITSMIKADAGNILILIVGFVILNLLFRIPYAGLLILIVAVCLGFGAIIYTVKENWGKLTSSA